MRSCSGRCYHAHLIIVQTVKITLWINVGSVYSSLPIWRISSYEILRRFKVNKYQYHGPLTRYVKLRVAHAPGMPGTFSPPPRVGDTDMHHDMCVTHVPWYMPGSLTSGFLRSRRQGKRSRHFRRMPNPQFYVSDKRPMQPFSPASPWTWGHFPLNHLKLSRVECTESVSSQHHSDIHPGLRVLPLPLSSHFRKLVKQYSCLQQWHFRPSFYRKTKYNYVHSTVRAYVS